MNVPETAERAVVVNSPSLDHVISCDECGERFADLETFDSHQRTDEQRNPPCIKFLKGAAWLPKCIQPSTLWAMGWTRARSSSKPRAVRKLAAVWSKPVAPPLRPHKKRSGDEWVCLVCKKAFASATGFKAHHVHTFTSAERCLDSDELKTLGFELSASAVWKMTNTTHYLPSQIARLPTVRQELAKLAALASATAAERGAL